MNIERVPADVGEPLFRELAAFLLPMAQEVAIVPFDMENASRNGYLALTQGMTLIARDADGAIVGTLAGVRMDVWYAAEGAWCIIDNWFYVSPAARFGRVGVGLIRGMREIAVEQGVPAFIRVVNPSRRPPNDLGGAYATVAGFSPFGKLVRIA